MKDEYIVCLVLLGPFILGVLIMIIICIGNDIKEYFYPKTQEQKDLDIAAGRRYVEMMARRRDKCKCCCKCRG